MSGEAKQPSIEVFTQGKQDRTLFGLIGPLVLNKEVQKILGNPITSELGDVWHVLSDGKGFALTHPDPETRSAHVKFVHADTAPLRKALLRAAHDTLRQMGISDVMTFAPEVDRLWASLGYEMIKHARGNYHTWRVKLHGGSSE